MMRTGIDLPFVWKAAFGWNCVVHIIGVRREVRGAMWDLATGEQV
jgi:hypothetical protein